MKNYTINIIVEGFNDVKNHYESDSKEIIRDIMTPVEKEVSNKIMTMTTFDTTGNKIVRHYVHTPCFNYLIEITIRADAL